jgi:hypothetical protein
MILFPVTSRPGNRPTEAAGRLVNCYAEPLGEGARTPAGTPMVRRRSPGLVRAASSTLFGCRALHAVGDTLLGAFTGQVATIDLSAGTMTVQGALGGGDRITIASNNASTPNIVAVTDLGAFNLFTNSAPTSFADADLPTSPGPTSVAFQAGYFFFSYADGRIFASGVNAVTIDSTHFTTYQERPGGVTRLIPFRGDLLAMGPFAVGIYRNTANPTGFPYSLLDTIGKGLISKFAVAGHENGWVDELLWVGDDNVVYHLQGYAPVPVSTPDVVRSIEAVEDKDDLDAVVYMAGAHAFWAISGPGFTWEFNLSTGQWHERESYHRKRWRAQCSIRHQGRWLVGDTVSGNLFAVDGDVQTEDGGPLIMEAWSIPAAAFPARIAYPRAEFDVVVGQGRANGEDPIETAPRIAISWSDDGGASFGAPLLRELGGEGEFQTRITLNRTGLAGPQGRVWKVVVSDPRYIGLLGGAKASQERST